MSWTISKWYSLAPCAVCVHIKLSFLSVNIQRIRTSSKCPCWFFLLLYYRGNLCGITLRQRQCIVNASRTSINAMPCQRTTAGYIPEVPGTAAKARVCPPAVPDSEQNITNERTNPESAKELNAMALRRRLELDWC